jgi:RNAse (barnase) inhibitor barstar
MGSAAYVLDGRRISSLEGFYDEFERVVLSGAPWGRNLDALDDVLRGGFGTPEAGFEIVWRRSGLSRRVLGHEATVRYLKSLRARVSPDGAADLASRIADAQRGRGATLFEEIVAIIRDHGAGGAEAEDGVRLVLEE